MDGCFVWFEYNKVSRRGQQLQSTRELAVNDGALGVGCLGVPLFLSVSFISLSLDPYFSITPFKALSGHFCSTIARLDF